MLPPLPPARSPLQRRSEKFQRLRATTYDLLVIGGGITGAAVAREAALRGWRVALVERGDFGGGTSSRSARILHGGLRYIAMGQLGVVAEASRERNALLHHAPHLVRPLPHIAVVYDRLQRAAVVRSALALYHLIGGRGGPGPQRGLSRRELARLEPSAALNGLRTAVRYHEATADDARLTLATILAAERLNAVVVNYAAAEALLKAVGQVQGAAVRDALTGETLEVRARAVVNATGPWNPQVQRLDRPNAQSSMHPSKGIHVVVPHARLPLNDAMAFQGPGGGRDMYGLRWRHTTLLGTTDVDYAGDPDEVCATGDEVRQVLASTRRAFPQARLTEADVLSTFAGVRPLVEQEGMGAYQMSREHRVSVSESGLVSITGGKLTTHRRMARDTVEAVAQRLGLPEAENQAAAQRSAKLPLEEAAIPAAGAEALGAEALAHLQSAYGARWGHVAALALQVPGLEARVTPALPYLKAELAFAVQQEMALTLSDVLIRRLHVIHEDAHQGLDLAAPVAESLAGLLGWTAEETGRQVAAYEHQVALTRRWREG